MKNKIILKRIDKIYLSLLTLIVLVSLYSINVNAFYGSSNNFIYSSEYAFSIDSPIEIDYIGIHKCSYDMFDLNNNYIYCLSPNQDKIYTIKGVYSNGYLNFDSNFIIEDYQEYIHLTENYLFTSTYLSDKYLYQYPKDDISNYIYIDIPDTWLSFTSAKNYLYVVGNDNVDINMTVIKKINESIDYSNINNSIINSINFSSCTALYYEDIYYNYNLDIIIIKKICSNYTSEIYFLDSNLNHIKNKTGLDDSLSNIIFYEVNQSNYFLLYDNKVEKYNNDILGNTLYGNIFNLGENSHYYNHSENIFYTCNINLSCSSNCTPLSYLTSESVYGILPIFQGTKSIFSSKIIDSSSCLISELSTYTFVPDIFIESNDVNHFFGYEEGYELITFYIETVSTTTTTVTTTSTSTTTSSSSTSSTSSTSTSSTSSTTSLISNEDLNKINQTYTEAYSIYNKTSNAIEDGVDSLLASEGASFEKISLGKSQQKEESQNIILLFLDFIMLLLVLILLFSMMTVIKQKRNRYY